MALKVVSFERWHNGIWISESQLTRQITVLDQSLYLRMNSKILHYIETVRNISVEMLEGPLAGKRENHQP